MLVERCNLPMISRSCESIVLLGLDEGEFGFRNAAGIGPLYIETSGLRSFSIFPPCQEVWRLITVHEGRRAASPAMIVQAVLLGKLIAAKAYDDDGYSYEGG